MWNEGRAGEAGKPLPLCNSGFREWPFARGSGVVDRSAGGRNGKAGLTRVRLSVGSMRVIARGKHGSGCSRNVLGPASAGAAIADARQ